MAAVLEPLTNNNQVGGAKVKLRCFLKSDDNIWAMMHVDIQKASAIPDILFCMKIGELFNSS